MKAYSTAKLGHCLSVNMRKKLPKTLVLIIATRNFHPKKMNNVTIYNTLWVRFTDEAVWCRNVNLSSKDDKPRYGSSCLP